MHFEDVLEYLQKRLEIGERCNLVLEHSMVTVFHAEAFNEAPQDVQVAMTEAQGVPGHMKRTVRTEPPRLPAE